MSHRDLRTTRDHYRDMADTDPRWAWLWQQLADEIDAYLRQRDHDNHEAEVIAEQDDQLGIDA